MFEYAEDDNLWREDLFAILDVTEETDKKGIRDRYKQLAKKFHPDRFPLGSPEQLSAKEMFSKINMAYDVLTTDIKRQNYLETRRLLSEHLESGQSRPLSASNPKQENAKKREVENFKKQQAEEIYLKAEKLHKRGNLEDAIAAYQEAIDMSPKLGKYHSHLGQAYMTKGWNGMAQAAFKKALMLNPNDPIAQQYYKPERVKKEKGSLLDSIFGKFKKKP